MCVCMKYVGLMQLVLGSMFIINLLVEWLIVDGMMLVNFDVSDVIVIVLVYGVVVSNSGVMNYLNKFGLIICLGISYKINDFVGELYYVMLWYYCNFGNVFEWSNFKQINVNVIMVDIMIYVDGFLVIIIWDDLIFYLCQKNFIFGIGDENIYVDCNVLGNISLLSNEFVKLVFVMVDMIVDVVIVINVVGKMVGIIGLVGFNNYLCCCDNNGVLMVGLVYDVNMIDICLDDLNNLKILG